MANFFAFENMRQLGDVRAFELEARERIKADKARAAAAELARLAEQAIQQASQKAVSHEAVLDTALPAQVRVRAVAPEAAV